VFHEPNEDLHFFLQIHLYASQIPPLPDASLEEEEDDPRVGGQ
jgi:hypothetical protein